MGESVRHAQTGRQAGGGWRGQLTTCAGRRANACMSSLQLAASALEIAIEGSRTRFRLLSQAMARPRNASVIWTSLSGKHEINPCRSKLSIGLLPDTNSPGDSSSSGSICIWEEAMMS